MPQPTSKHHAEWLSLLEVSGPFLSMPVLTGAFPQGLDELPDGLARSLRADFAFWQEKAEDPAVHTAWIRLVLESVLGYGGEDIAGADTATPLLSGQAISAGWKAEFPEHEETLRPDFMLVEAPTPSPSPEGRGGRAPHLLVQVFPPSQDLNRAVQGSRWQASAATRMMELLHATEVRLGLVTNGAQWMLVHAPRGETTGFATWEAGLWFDEPITLRAFVSLLGIRRFFGVAEDATLENLLKASANDQQEITDQLGLQVRHAVEILIQMIDRADQDSGGALLAEIGVEEKQVPVVLYESALTVMMRLVFLLSAEERKLLPLDDSLYAEFYAVSTLRAQLRELADQHGEEVLERRYDAWSRLLATFRAVHGGIRHERLSLPPYGGSLFNPEKYPFLEGRSGTRTNADGRGDFKEKDLIRVIPRSSASDVPLPVNNRTVLHLLEALQVLQVDGEARRLSFRALDVEQIGHVYEGLLDHTAVRAEETMLGLRGAKRMEPEIALSALEQARAGSESSFIAWLKAETGRSESALRNALASDISIENLRRVCGDEALVARIAPFAGLLREDDFGAPVVILPGSVYVTSGTTRRATGTHYTPRSLTEPVVQHTLEPLVYAGPAEGLAREQWRLRNPQELLDLKVCDMAMGSGGFLVQVVRYLAERLVESSVNGNWGMINGTWVEVNESGCAPNHPSPITNYHLPLALEAAMRFVAERCVYGVDKNPLAVEIAKLSLWLVTLAKDLPFTFVDHALKCGDSLVGASADDFERWAHVIKDSTMLLWKDDLLKNLETAREKRRELESFVVRDVQDAERKQELLKQAEAATERVWRGADLITGARLLGLKAQELEGVLDSLAMAYGAGELFGELSPLRPSATSPKSDEPQSDLGDALRPDLAKGRVGAAARALQAAKKERAFHWEFAFPEVFERGGFSAFVGNPPFVWGNRISSLMGDYYREWLSNLFSNYNGNADLCAHFFRKAFHLLAPNIATLGFIATNSISETNSRVYGVEPLLISGGKIIRAQPDFKWPGSANLSISILVIFKGAYRGTAFINEQPVNSISSFLDETETNLVPYKLLEQSGIAFKGVDTGGLGFVVTDEEKKQILNREPFSENVIWPFLNGQDFLTDYMQKSSRLIINFTGMDEKKARAFPLAMSIVEERVRPYRETVKRQRRKDNWWIYNETMPGLYKAISGYQKCLVNCVVSKFICFDFAETRTVFSNALNVISQDSFSWFSILQSTLHEFWARYYGSSLESRNRYNVTDCFETFPFPRDLSGLEDIGERYHETRRQIMLARQEGLTKTYNRFHNPEEQGADIAELRRLHVEMDEEVARAYGWGELGIRSGELGAQSAIPNSQPLILDHDFHETPQGIRYTISESARREVLSRLLKLNHERHEEEMKNAEGRMKNEKAKTGKPKNRKADDGQMGMF